MPTDVRGLDITVTNAEALTEYDKVLTDLWNYRLAAPKNLKRVLELDPDFPMAHVVRGYIMSMLETVAVRPKMLASASHAREHLAADARRERLHCDALEGLATGNLERACAAWEAILADYPHDLLALKMHHHSTFWTGRSYVIRNTVAGVFDLWDESIPGYSFVLGMLAFALEECGDYAQAEAFGRQSIDMNPDDLWAIHSVAHVMEMQGRLDEGIALIDRPVDQWADRNPFQGHNWWHLALFTLERGDYDFTLDIYDNRILTSNTEFFLDVQNGASMLKRLELLGVDVGDRWEPLAEYARKRVDDHVLAFTDLHSLMALASADDKETAQAYINALESFAHTPDNYAASLMADVVVPMGEGVLAFENEEYARAVDVLWPLRDRWFGIGGSHAQRDIFTQILIEAAIRAERYEQARALLAQRALLRPNSLGSWQKYATVLQACGDDSRAEHALQRAAGLHS